MPPAVPVVIHLPDDLLPNVDIRQLRTVLRHVRIRFEHHDRFFADGGGPIGTEPHRLQRGAAIAHLFRDRRKIVGVGQIIVVSILAGREHAAERVTFVHRPCHHQHIGCRQRIGAAAVDRLYRRRRQAFRPFDVDIVVSQIIK